MMAYDANFRHINLVYYILQISIPGCPVLWRQKVLTIYIYIYIYRYSVMLKVSFRLRMAVPPPQSAFIKNARADFVFHGGAMVHYKVTTNQACPVTVSFR